VTIPDGWSTVTNPGTCWAAKEGMVTREDFAARYPGFAP